MNLSSSWKVFVIFPSEPERIQSREARFDLGLTAFGAKAVDREVVVWSGDEFEAQWLMTLGT